MKLIILCKNIAEKSKFYYHLGEYLWLDLSKMLELRTDRQFTYHPVYLITGDVVNDSNTFLKNLQISLSSGIQMVQIRAKSLTIDDYRNLATTAVKLCHSYNTKVLLNTHLFLVNEVGADGCISQAMN